ncbi:MAG: hypothetical protein ACXVCS_11640 [Bdellovibrionota bacterium]
MPSLYTMLATKRAYGADACTAAVMNSKTPFICIDLAGGGNIAGSNVIVGKAGGQLDFLAAYDKLGLPTSMSPQMTGQTSNELGLTFHADSAMLRGIRSVTSATTRANVDGMVLCTVSNHDTGNNPTNPMYWIAKSGLNGTLTTLGGTSNSISGGNSTVPPASINPASQPIRLASSADARGLVSLGQLNVLFTPTKIDSIMATIENMSAGHLATFQSKDLPTQISDVLNCNYTKSRAVAQDGPDGYDPLKDAMVAKVFPNVATNSADQAVATMAKLVLDQVAGGGTIQKGGYDYHSGNRADGETADFAAGVAIGQCLELAAAKGKDLMLYVFTDGGITSNTTVDNSTAGRGKLSWSGDSGDRSASFVLMYKAGGVGRPAMRSAARQIGAFSDAGQGVDTKSSLIATNVTTQAQAVVLNYLALDGSESKLGDVIGGSDPFTGVENNYLMFNKQG